MKMKDRLITHLIKLVSYYPISSDQKAVKSLLDYCLKVMNGSGSFSDAKILSNGGVNSLYASTRGTKKPFVMLNGHIDVVAASKLQQNLQLKGNKAYGRGALDDLFATAIFLTLIEELQSDLSTLDLGVMLTGDEELGGTHGVGTLVKKGYIPSLSIMPDAGNGFGDLNTGCRGIYNCEVTIKGKSHHGSRPWDGDGAANKLVSFLSELLKLTPNTESALFTIVATKLEAGDSMNKAPASAKAHLDIRYESEAILPRIQKELNRLLKKYNGKVTNVSAGVAFNLDLENELVKDFMNLYKTKSDKVTLSKTTGSSDARYFAALKVPVIMLRPLGADIHGDNEWIDIEELEKIYELIKEYLLKIAKI
jgi:succinyl-diaminopimelate desuccinylase